MKVILIKDVSGIGRSGDVKEVSDGYARNFLIGKGFAVPASQTQVDKISKEKREQSDKIARQEAKLIKLADDISKKTINFKRKVNGTKLFAAIHEQDIITEINTLFGVELDPKQVLITNPIKTTGKHHIILKLTNQHKATVTVNVEPQ